MFRLAAIVYLIVGTTVMGIAVTAVLATPSLADDYMKWIPICAGAGAAFAMPVSYLVAKAIDKQIRKG